MKDRLSYPGLHNQPDGGERRGAVGRTLQRILRAQFGRPSGVLGDLVGRVMARSESNLDRMRWTISMLDLKATDRVLEIGFGPGIALRLVSERTLEGFVAGVDHSEVMVRQARKRNAKTVREGKVSVHLGSASSLPDFSELFDKIFTINSIHFWPDPVECLVNLRRLLKPGGVIAVTLQPRSRNATDATSRLIGDEVASNLGRAGFTDCRLEIRPTKPVAVACAIGVNPGQ